MPFEKKGKHLIVFPEHFPAMISTLLFTVGRKCPCRCYIMVAPKMFMKTSVETFHIFLKIEISSIFQVSLIKVGILL